jgi:hypothetical protein
MPQKTRTAEIALVDGIVRVTILARVKQSLDDAKANLAGATVETGNQPRPMLVDIRLSEPLEPDARHFYAEMGLSDSFTALAMLLHASPLGQMVGDIYFRIAKHRVPLRLFRDEAEAVAWLSSHIKAPK